MHLSHMQSCTSVLVIDFAGLILSYISTMAVSIVCKGFKISYEITKICAIIQMFLSVQYLFWYVPVCVDLKWKPGIKFFLVRPAFTVLMHATPTLWSTLEWTHSTATSPLLWNQSSGIPSSLLSRLQCMGIDLYSIFKLF